MAALQVAKLLKNRILVGHALENDLACLMLAHPRKLIRDTSRYPPLMRQQA
jgi:RNA exonuclease 4